MRRTNGWTVLLTFVVVPLCLVCRGYAQTPPTAQPAAGGTSSVPGAAQALKPYEAPLVPKATDWSNERLAQFMRDLTAFVYANHVVTNTDAKTYGMTYEFWRDGKKIQQFGLDTMHDGAWFTSAMITANRIDPEGKYLGRAQSYQAPFYANMLIHSDKLFPKKERAGEDNKAPEEPLKGWVPRGWDEGIGYDLTTGKQIPDSYGTPSNHLAQDLADMLLNAWLTTRDPAVLEAMKWLNQYRTDYFMGIKVLDYAYGFMTQNLKLLGTYDLPKYGPGQSVVNAGMYQQAQAPLDYSGNDDLAWAYRRAAAEASTTGELSPDFAWNAAYSVYSTASGMEMYFDDRPWSYGLGFFDIQGPPSFVRGKGKLSRYVSAGGLIFGGRGIQLSWIGAAVLPAIKKHPEIWEKPYRDSHAAEPLIRMVDTPPVTDGKRDAIYDQSKSVIADDTKITLISDPKNLHVLIESSRPKVSLTIRDTAEVTGEKITGLIEAGKDGIVTVKNDKEILPAQIDTLGKDDDVTMKNDKGETLLYAAEVSKGAKWTAEVRIPYTIVPAQAQWINGVEHGRYEVTVNNGQPATVYLLSDPQRIIRRLEALTLGTVQTWYDVWKELGCIPSGRRTHNQGGWEISDVGNFAHLIKDIAFVLIDRAGTSEWDLIKKETPAQPLPSNPLPDGALKAQGLK